MEEIRPENSLAGHIHVECHHVLQLRDQTCVFFLIQCHLSHLMMVGKVQVRNLTYTAIKQMLVVRDKRVFFILDHNQVAQGTYLNMILME